MLECKGCVDVNCILSIRCWVVDKMPVMSAFYIDMTLGYYVQQTLGIGQLPTKVKTNQISTSNDVRLEHSVDVGIIMLGRH